MHHRTQYRPVTGQAWYRFTYTEREVPSRHRHVSRSKGGGQKAKSGGHAPASPLRSHDSHCGTRVERVPNISNLPVIIILLHPSFLGRRPHNTIGVFREDLACRLRPWFCICGAIDDGHEVNVSYQERHRKRLRGKKTMLLDLVVGSDKRKEGREDLDKPLLSREALAAFHSEDIHRLSSQNTSRQVHCYYCSSRE